MAKQLLYTDEARKKLLAGADKLAHAVGITLGPTGRNVILDKSLRRSDRHQGRRHRQQGDRAARPLREHGRQAGQRRRPEDQRRRRRRHHDRDHPGPVHLPGRPAQHHRRRQPDGRQARHRQGRRGRRRAPRQACPSGSPRRRRWQQVASISANNDPDIGKHDGRRLREGRQGRRHHRRGRQDLRDDARVRRGHAVRQGLHLALLRHQPAGHDVRAGGRAAS